MHYRNFIINTALETIIGKLETLATFENNLIMELLRIKHVTHISLLTSQEKSTLVCCTPNHLGYENLKMSLDLVGQQQLQLSSCKCKFLNVIDSLVGQIRLRVTDIVMVFVALVSLLSKQVSC